MLRIGKGKPGICVSQGDSHHPGRPFYSSNDFVWVGLNDWIDIKSFQEFNMKADFSDPLSLIIAKPIWESTLKYLIDKAGGYQLWQRNFISRDLETFVRHMILLGEPNQFVRWSWFDANVKYYFYIAIAWFKNINRG